MCGWGVGTCVARGCALLGGVHGRGGMHGGGHAWLGGVHGRGVCMAGGCAWQGGMCGWGVSMAKGVCMVRGGVRGKGGTCMANGGGVRGEGGRHAWYAHPPLPPSMRYSRSMHGQYASYWNAFLFSITIANSFRNSLFEIFSLTMATDCNTSGVQYLIYKFENVDYVIFLTM